VNRKKKLAVKRSQSGGLGLFTNWNIKKGDFIIEYTGEKISSDEADRRGGRYLFTINSKWVIDAKNHKHRARYINHSCRPNCEVINEGGELNVYAKKDIKPGDELSYYYGRGYFEDFIKPVGCRCGWCQRRKTHKQKP